MKANWDYERVHRGKYPSRHTSVRRLCNVGDVVSACFYWDARIQVFSHPYFPYTGKLGSEKTRISAVIIDSLTTCLSIN